MILHCQKGYPLEACGILAGHKRRVDKVYPMKNVDKSAVSYQMDPKELVRLDKTLRLEGRSMLGIFHSHVASEPSPSQTDINLAFYPEAAYVIISLIDRGNPLAKGYRIVEGEVSPVELKIV